MRGRLTGLIVTVVLIVAGAAGTAGIAHADGKPWAAGVSAGDQKKALALYREGNAFFQQAQYKEALATYERALEAWDHPAIRYNAAVCLINMDRPALAWDYLESALRFGEAPLGRELYEEARRYQQQLAADTGTLEVACEVPGAQVQLDGEPLFVGPGTVTRRLAKGKHSLVTTKEPEYTTSTQEVEVVGGSARSVTIELAKREVITRVQRTEMRRRWATWKPFALVGAGALVAGGGGLAFVLADRKNDAGDELSARFCPCTPGDPRGQEVRDAFSAADAREKLGWVMLGVGSAAVATGIVLVVLNQPREIAVAPTVEQPGLAVSGRF